MKHDRRLEAFVVRLVMTVYSAHASHISTDRHDHTDVLPVATVLAFCTFIDLSRGGWGSAGGWRRARSHSFWKHDCPLEAFCRVACDGSLQHTTLHIATYGPHPNNILLEGIDGLDCGGPGGGAGGGSEDGGCEGGGGAGGGGESIGSGQGGGGLWGGEGGGKLGGVEGGGGEDSPAAVVVVVVVVVAVAAQAGGGRRLRRRQWRRR